MDSVGGRRDRLIVVVCESRCPTHTWQQDDGHVPPKFDNLRSHIRRMGRNATKREVAAGSAAGTSGGKRRAADVEDGEISDGGASRASLASSSVSKLARKAQNGFDIR